MRGTGLRRALAAAALLLALAIPSVALAQDMTAMMAQLKEAAGQFNVPPGTFDEGAPSPQAVADAIAVERITNDGYPENFQVAEVYSITRPGSESDTQGMWLVRYRTNLRVGALQDPVFIEIVTYDPANNIPLGVGGFFSIDPWWSLQLTAAKLTGAGITTDALADWIKSQPLPAGTTTSAAAIASALMGLLGAASGLVPKPGSGVSTLRVVPTQLGEYHGDMWHWVYRNGKWQMIQGYNVQKEGWYEDPDGVRRYYKLGQFRSFGKPIPGSIFTLPDPSLLGARGAIFTTPTTDVTGNATAATKALGDFLDTGVGKNLDPAVWKTLDARQRSVVIKGLVSRGARATGLTDTRMNIVVGHDADRGLGGSWAPRSRELFINTNSSKFDDPQEVVRVIFHELRHAAQGDPKAQIGDASYDKLMKWNDAAANYHDSGTDYTRYSGQLQERDADVAGKAIRDAVFKHLGAKK